MKALVELGVWLWLLGPALLLALVVLLGIRILFKLAR